MKDQKNHNTEEHWFKEGLKFGCTECGKCCSGLPGYVWVSEQEVENIANSLQISPKEFIKKYVRQVNGAMSLLEYRDMEDHNQFACVFLKDKKCSIYSERPMQCRTFPWWPGNLHSKKGWLEAAKECEGINHPDAPIVPYEKIMEQLKKQQDYSDTTCRGNFSS